MHPVFDTLYDKQMRHFIPTNCQLVTKKGYKITVYNLYIRYVALLLQVRCVNGKELINSAPFSKINTI